MTRPEAKSHIGLGEIAGQEVVLAKPQTMMNLSGVAVRMLLERYECDARRDDRFDRRGRSALGNAAHSHTRPKQHAQRFASQSSACWERMNLFGVRMGVQPEQQWDDRKDYLLAEMSRAEREAAQQEAVDAAEAVQLILTDGVEKAMLQYNRRVSTEAEGSE